MNCIIVDDEPIARQGMVNLIHTVPELEIKGAFKNTVEAQLFLSDNVVDLIFLDIELPGMNGLDFARSLPQQALVIFTTAYAQYALGSYEVDAVDYLVKPIREERFRKAVDKALQYHAFLMDTYKKSEYDSVAEECIFIRADRKLHKVLFRDILYLEGMKDYVVLYLQSGTKLVTAMNLKTALSKLPSLLFKRTSKSFAVNLGQVTAVSNHIVFVNDMELPLGVMFKEEFLAEYLNSNR